MPHSHPSEGVRGQESVTDYPSPPRVEPDTRRVIVRFNGEVIADSRRAHRVLERDHAPVFYLPPEDVRVELLQANGEQTWCGFKGDAHYYDLVVGERVSPSAAWCYPEPLEGFEAIAYEIAFYPDRVDECSVDNEVVKARPGDPAGGWVTSEVTGPFKGEPGAQGW